MSPIGEHIDPRAAPAERGGVEERAAAPPRAVERRPELVPELLAVACIAVVPALVEAVHYRLAPYAIEPSAYYARILLRSLYVAIPLLFIARRGGMAWRELGLVRPRWKEGVAGALMIGLLVVLLFGVDGTVQRGWWAWSGSVPWLDDAPTDESLEGAGFATVQRAPLAVAGIVATHLANGFAEELAMCAYLITRLRAATGSLAVALLLSNVAFTSYHVYYDASGITAVFGFGALLTAGWLVTRNLWVVALAHALFNLALEFL